MPLEFSEYHLPPVNEHRQLPQACDAYELANQSLAIGGASVQSVAFNAKTELIVVSQISADCRVAFGPQSTNGGAGPAAIAAGAGQTRFLKTGTEYAFRVRPGDLLAVIAA